jgi:hypothetical protein
LTWRRLKHWSIEPHRSTHGSAPRRHALAAGLCRSRVEWRYPKRSCRKPKSERWQQYRSLASAGTWNLLRAKLAAQAVVERGVRFKVADVKARLRLAEN